MSLISVALSVSWAVLAHDSEVYMPGALSSAVINVGFMGVCYSILIFVVVPTLKKVVKTEEDPNCCTRSFYGAFLLFASVGLIGAFAAGFTQVFGAHPSVKSITPNHGNESNNTVSNSLDPFGLAAACVNFFTALVAFLLIAAMVLIINQNPWRRCGHDAHLSLIHI